MSSQIMPSEAELKSNRAEEDSAREDARLWTDIRLLGRILGDTVRDQEGVDVFDLVERIRQTSIRFHRDNDRPARRELEIILDSMSTSETVRIVRAFSYFSHLANIAEDQNNIRQMRARSAAGGSPRPGHVGGAPFYLIRLLLGLALALKNCDSRVCRAVSGAASHVVPDHAFRG